MCIVDIPYAVFEVKKDEKMTDFEKVRQRIEQLTNDEAGGQKNIVDKEIIMTVYSANAPDLTVIDLPGITRNPIGDQPKNIEEITRNMADRYSLSKISFQILLIKTHVLTNRFVKDERTIILCVVAANADISTSDALQMAMRIDPKGDRTIGVITKVTIDIIARFSDILIYSDTDLISWTREQTPKTCLQEKTFH